ncbi:cache domain-containing protein [Vibrio sp. JC009]|uniref:sensor histidine kinase n=1 Tax=Vibrio sp. JC009 TaxID=2912314 RepID=UPI0023B050E5|nr:ATP-binding protein [Vibrio sp. JC009]WED20852.1 cache domain-containing protein [Vibrio sp. JC009]
MDTANQTSVKCSLKKYYTLIKTKVRYRLLVLTTVPVLLTIVVLIGIALYWGLAYTWKNALTDVEERLWHAENFVETLKLRQSDQVKSIANSSELYRLFHSSEPGKNHRENEINRWLEDKEQQSSLDYLRWRRADDSFLKERLAESESQVTFLQVMDSFTLNSISTELRSQAHLSVLYSQGIESRGLVIRTLVPVYIDGKLAGGIDAGTLVNNSCKLVDSIRDHIYLMGEGYLAKEGTVTVFLDDLRIATNVPAENLNSKNRALGTYASQEVTERVIKNEEKYVDSAYVYDDWYISSYHALYDYKGNVVGMLYTGYKVWPLINQYLNNLLAIALMILATLVIGAWFVYRESQALFYPIERISNVVSCIRKGKDKRIGNIGLNDQHELNVLAEQFDRMLDLLQERNHRIKSDAELLEQKVEERTESLVTKTIELQHHIQLLNDTRDKLVVSEKLAALGKLTAGIAHEINNPTAVILGNTELLKYEFRDEPERGKEELDMILDQLDRIRKITRSLLQYSRSDDTCSELSQMDINALVKESAILVKSGIKPNKFTIDTELNATEFAEVSRSQLLQVLINLLMNAIQATGSAGSIKVSTENWVDKEACLGCVIRVCDNGAGIAPDDIAQIFDPFFTTKKEGTGLGLSVSQSLLEQVGGTIKVQSEPGKGSEFAIFLRSKAEFSDVS